MKLGSTTLTANNESIIGDALRSVVDVVDVCLVIDTGVTDRTLEVAREAARDKLLVRTFDWTNDFAAARNFALDAACDAGCDWAMTVDTDERIHLCGLDLRSELGACTEGVLMVESEARDYAKDRLFRLPTTVRWEGPTHEFLPSWKVGVRTLKLPYFTELPKTPEAAARKFAKDASILAEYLERHPNESRWHYYLGESFKHLERPREAIAAYEACAALRGWNEESAWACYRAAECHVTLGEYRAAIDSCAAGMARHAGLAELPWLAAFCAYRSGDNTQAVYWSELAIALGHYRGIGKTVSRIGFRFLPGLYEGPYDVLRFALREVDPQGAAEAERHYHLARAARQGRAKETSGCAVKRRRSRGRG